MNLDKYVKKTEKSNKKIKKPKKSNSENTVENQAESILSENDYLLLGVAYNGESRKAVANLYGQKKFKQHFDSSGHLPYLISNRSEEEIEKEYPKVKQHEGFERVETISLENLIIDKKIDMTKVIANDPLSIGGKSNSIREILKGYSWEDKIRYHNCYIYDKGLIPGLIYNEVNGDLIKKEFQIPKDLEEQIINLFSTEKEEFKEHYLKFLNYF